MAGGVWTSLPLIGLLLTSSNVQSFRYTRVSSSSILNPLYASQQTSLPRDVIICTTIGGSFSGLISGGLIDGLLAHGDAPYSSPLGACLVGGATLYALQNNDSEINDVLIPLFGQPIIDAKNDITQSITSKIESTRTALVNLPDTVKSTIQQKINNIQAAANQKVEDTKAEVYWFSI